MTASTAPPEGSFLATGRGKITLTLLCLVTFLDVMDGAIVNIVLLHIRTHLGFSVQNLQWVVSGYLITYGGFLLLGGRAGDLLGRRRLLIAGTVLFAASSLACGLADSQGLLVGARLAQGLGAAMMSPAALSILATTFQGSDRHKALGVWAGISAMATAVGLIIGGLLTTNFGWRWVFFVSLPIAALVLFGALRILKADHGRSVPGGFDALGAVLVTASMLLLIFTLVKAPDEGWGAGRTIGGLAASAVLMAAFVVNEQRRGHPLVPLSIFRIKGLAHRRRPVEAETLDIPITLRRNCSALPAGGRELELSSVTFDGFLQVRHQQRAAQRCFQRCNEQAVITPRRLACDRSRRKASQPVRHTPLASLGCCQIAANLPAE